MGIKDKNSVEPYGLVETIMTYEQKWHLIEMNDGSGDFENNQQSFNQIADWIEANL